MGSLKYCDCDDCFENENETSIWGYYDFNEIMDIKEIRDIFYKKYFIKDKQYESSLDICDECLKDQFGDLLEDDILTDEERVRTVKCIEESDFNLMGILGAK